MPIQEKITGGLWLITTDRRRPGLHLPGHLAIMAEGRKAEVLNACEVPVASNMISLLPAYSDANARLIAAAPILLAELIALSGSISIDRNDYPDNDLYKFTMHNLKRAKEALKLVDND